MNFGKWLVILGVIGIGIHFLHVHQNSAANRALLASADSYGFVPVAPPDGATPDTVIILAALNCPKPQAARADAIAAELTRMGIPNRRSNYYSISNIAQEQMPLIAQTNAVLRAGIPLVVINGMAKANPSLDDVVAEYRRDR